MKRLFDILVSLIVLALCVPIFVIVAAVIAISSPGPIFFHAIRMGKGEVPFRMLKFRTMNVSTGGPVITAEGDARIFSAGAVLRRLKLDELPQFINVLMGQMSIVGPRPEDPKIVKDHYTDWMRETLGVRPGITSLGSIFYYIHGESLVDNGDAEASYVNLILVPKLAIERGYIENATFWGDIRCVFMTVATIIGQIVGVPINLSRKDMQFALRWAPRSAFPKQVGF